MLVLSWVAIPEAHPSPRFCVLCVSSFLSPPTLKLPKGVAAVEKWVTARAKSVGRYPVVSLSKLSE